MREALQETSFAKLLSDIVADAGTLFRQELQLAKAEAAGAVHEKVRALTYAIVAGLFVLVAVLLLSLALVIGFINYGIPPHWAVLMVALAACAIAAVAILAARSKLARTPLARRSIDQMNQNVAAAKEALQ